MSNEIRLSVNLSVQNPATGGGYQTYWNETDSYTQNSIGASAGVASATTTMANLDVGSVATAGYLFLKNVDGTHSVQWGLNVTGSFVAVGLLGPAEIALLRVDPSVTVALQSVAGTVPVQYLLLND